MKRKMAQAMEGGKKVPTHRNFTNTCPIRNICIKVDLIFSETSNKNNLTQMIIKDGNFTNKLMNYFITI
jgi:hypothetical protein